MSGSPSCTRMKWDRCRFCAEPHGHRGPLNQWWMDVLENGPSSMYAPYFDMNGIRSSRTCAQSSAPDFRRSIRARARAGRSSRSISEGAFFGRFADCPDCQARSAVCDRSRKIKSALRMDRSSPRSSTRRIDRLIGSRTCAQVRLERMPFNVEYRAYIELGHFRAHPSTID